MRLLFLNLLYCFYYAECKLWSKGVVHYAINKKDYDLHSQDIISSTFEQLERELCVKFFNLPPNFNATTKDKILYIANPDKRKNCPPEQYKYDGTIVEMPIGYKCLNEQDISRIIVDMLRASIEGPSNPNSNDLLRKFQEKNDASNSLLTASDRNFINKHYHEECGDLLQKPVQTRRSSGGTMVVSADNERFYEGKLWPLGIVMYGVDSRVSHFPEVRVLKKAMSVIEMASCVVFQEVSQSDALQPKNLLWFGFEGEEGPNLGFMEGNQSIILHNMVYGAPGHNAHTLNFLMRVLGIPMMSNRYDRDSFIVINWKNVAKTKEHYLERLPLDAWLRNTMGEGAVYDYDSVTHAPANFMCGDCSLGQQTVHPLQDLLWQRTLSMGHRTDLSPADIEMLSLLYSKQCHRRFMNNK